MEGLEYSRHLSSKYVKYRRGINGAKRGEIMAKHRRKASLFVTSWRKSVAA